MAVASRFHSAASSDRAGRPGWILRPPQGLGGMDVPEPRQTPLVHQGDLDWGPGRAERVPELPPRERGEQRVRPERPHRRERRQGLHRVWLDASEEAGVPVVDDAAVGELQPGAAVRDGLPGRPPDPLPGHAQVREEALPGVERDEEHLAVAIGPGEPSA